MSVGVLRALFPSASFVADGAPALVDDTLYAEERDHIQRAVLKRRAEFGTARLYARRGFAAMGIPSAPILPGKDGAPIWPPGVAGSISHTAGYCAVVLGRAPPVRSLGLDVEVLQVLEAGILDAILTPLERAWLRAQPEERQPELAVVFFSAKEAYYKCQYPISGTFLEFGDVALEVDPDRRRFVATASPPRLPRDVARLEGTYALEDGFVFSGVELLG